MRYFFIGIFSFFSLFLNVSHSLATVPKVNMVLFSGNVYLINKAAVKTPAQIGEMFTIEKYPKIEIPSGSVVFLQFQNRMIKVSRSGILQFQQIFETPPSKISQTLSFLKDIGRPFNYISQTSVRGTDVTSKSKSDPFNKIWEELVQELPDQKTNVSANNLLATAAWFNQKEQPAKTAYTLEKLSRKYENKNNFYKLLRDESFGETSISDINEHISITKQLISQKIPDIKYKALLIGVDRYDHSHWAPLENPVKDIIAIGDILKRKYGFKPENIILKANPTFSDIIKSYNQLKKEVDHSTALLIYFAGHGYYPEDEDQGYWIPTDGGTPDSLKSFIPTSVILSKIKAIPTSHTLLIADSCFSGSLIQKSRGGANSKFYSSLIAKKSRQIITSGGLEPVSDNGGEGHSIFASKLLNILREDRQEPLSATELAFLLRKQVKAAGENQTPEYGRLDIPQDEQGEFFFVSNAYKKSIHETKAKKNPPSTPSAEGIEEKEKWINFGLFSVKIKNNENDPTGEKYTPVQKNGLQDFINFGISIDAISLRFDNVEDSTSDRVQRTIYGWGIHSIYRNSLNRWGYGIKGTIGKITTENKENEEEEDQSNERSLKGSYLRTGLFADYSVYTFRQFSLQVGGELRYLYASINDYLEKDEVIIKSTSLCINSSYPYNFNNWYINPFIDICSPPIWKGGNLSKISNGTEKNVDQYYSYSMGATVGIKF